MNIRACGSIPPDAEVARVHLPAVRPIRLALVASLLLAFLLTACDSSPAPVLKTSTATANLASENLYVACNDGVIHVLRARDGASVTQLGNPPTIAPALSDGVLYYGIGNPDATALVARDITAGRDLWRTATLGDVVGPPVIQQDTVYVAANTSRDGAASTIVALDKRNGAIRWSYESRKAILGSPTVSSDSVWAITWTGLRGSLLALRASDGTLLWRVPFAGGAGSSPALAQGILYIGSFSGALYALRADTGATVWIYQANNSIDAKPAVLNGVIYASAHDGTLFALNAADGRRLWTHSSIATHGDWGEILAQGQTLYVGAPDGLLYALDARTGVTLRAYQLDDRPPIKAADTLLIIWTAPLLRGGTLYVERTFGDNYLAKLHVPGQVVAIDRDTGAVRWTQTILDANCQPLVIG